MDPIVIHITGHPVPQGRPRAAVISGHAVLYKPKQSRQWENDARQVARQKMGSRTPLTGCLSLEMGVSLTPPQSWPSWKYEAAIEGKIRPTGRPDVSNYLKAAEDALNGVVWIDDSQVVSITVHKVYGQTPGVRLTVREIEDAHPAQITKRADLKMGTK